VIAGWHLGVASRAERGERIGDAGFVRHLGAGGGSELRAKRASERGYGA